MDFTKSHFKILFLFSSVQFSNSVVSDSLRPHELLHARPPCPSPSPGVHSNSCPLSWRCHPTISFSVFPFSSCHQSFPASGSFLWSQFFASGGQSIGASASVLPVNIQGWFSLGLTDLISLESKGLSRVSFNTTQFKNINSSALSYFLVQLSHPCMTTGKTIVLNNMDLCRQSNVSAL